MSWKTVLSFIVSATLLILLSGWLIKANLLPIHTEINYSEAERNFLKIWIQLALVIGVILPGVTFLIGIRQPKLRIVFGFYLLVVIIQLVTEQICSRVFSSSLLVIIGSIYTAFRVWQLWQELQFLKVNAQSANVSEQIAPGVLWLMLLFWSANLIFLLVVGWLRIL